MWNSFINLSNASEKKLLLDTRKNNFDAGSYIFPWFFFAKSRVVEFVSATVFFSFYIFIIIGFPLLVGELWNLFIKIIILVDVSYTVRLFLYVVLLIFVMQKQDFLRRDYSFPLSFPLKRGFIQRTPSSLASKNNCRNWKILCSRCINLNAPLCVSFYNLRCDSD